MNNRYLNAKTNWLIILALILGSASSPAQTKKLSDWVNVQVEKKKMKVEVNPQAVADSIVKQFEKTNSLVAIPPIVPAANPIGNSPSVGAPPVSQPAAVPPSGTPVPAASSTTTIAPIAPPAGISVSAAPPAVAPERESVKTTVPTVLGKPVVPKVTVIPLTAVQQAYDVAKAESGRDFTISANGQHYAYVKRLDLSSWAVVLDGKTGPAFSQIEELKIQSHGWDDDFSQIVYFAKDAESKPLLVVQTRNGEAKTYDAGLDGVYTGANGSKSINWGVSRELSVTSRRAVRYKGDGNNTAFQIGDGSPVMGPSFSMGRARASGFVFDSTYRHYAFNTFEARPSANPARRAEAHAVLYVDGQRAGQDGQTLEVLELFPDGGRYLKVTENGVVKYVVDGRVLAEGINPTTPLVSPDRKRAAWIEILGEDKNKSQCAVFVDGKRVGVYPASVQIEAMQFTDDSRSLMYVAASSGQSQVILDGAGLPVEAQRIRRLTAGPNKGQYAYFVGKEIVINGNRFPSVTTELHPSWFTPDGAHVVGTTGDCMFVDGTRIAWAGGEVLQAAAFKRFSRQPQQVGPQKWSFVLNQSPFQRVDIELAE